MLLKLIVTPEHHEKRLDIDFMDEATKHVGNTIFPKHVTSERKAKYRT